MMKLNSKYFDRIRVKPEEDRLLRKQVPTCEWPQCCGDGHHRAPKGRGEEGSYHYFCLEHVREYNKSYNYFNGMADNDVTNWQKSSRTGHRPTWKLGQNSWAAINGGRLRGAARERVFRAASDPFTVLGDSGGKPGTKPRQTVGNAQLKALHELGLDETASGSDVKTRYKALVKRLHPDANGGSRDSEEKLRGIIRAYSYLRKSGFRA